ncbi:hypothetical protein [Spirosoma knui]
MENCLQFLSRFLVISLVILFGSFWSGPALAQGNLVVTATQTAVCAGTSITLTAAGCPTTGMVRWSTAQAGNPIVVAPMQTTTYTAACVTSTTAATGTAVTSTTLATGTVTIEVSRAIIVSPISTSASCNGSSDGLVAIQATGGFGTLQYQFNGLPFSSESGYGNLKAGTYPIAVRDGRGCTVQTNVEVKQPPSLSLAVTVVGTKCVNGTDGGVIAVASGGNGNYQYLLDFGTPQRSGTFINLKANTTYQLSVADQRDCLLTVPISVTAPNPFDIKLDAKPTLCAGSVDGGITVAVTGGTAPYQYQLGTSAFQTGVLFTGLSASTYDITVRDANGCQGKKAVAVPEPAALRLTAVAGLVNCFGPNSGSITVTPAGGTGAMTYQLTTTRVPQASNVFTGLAAGDYTVVGNDANGCTSLLPVRIGVAEPLKLRATAIPASCCVCPTGAVQLVSTGGSGTNRQYQLIGQAYQANSQINGLRPNSYRFRVTDEVGCTDSIAAVVTDAASLTLSVGAIKNVSCTGGSNGEATVQVAGGAKPFTYYWLTERTDTLKARTATQTSLVEGTYTVSVLDSNRCTTATAFVTIKADNPSPFKPVISQSNNTLVVNQTAGIQWYVQTGSDPAKPVANGNQPVLIPFESGQYYATITVNGCPSPPSDPISFILTALNEPGDGLAIRVVPNPIVSRLRVEIEQSERSAVAIQLLDLSGRPVWQGQIPAFTGKKQAEWPLTTMPSGQYLLRAEAGRRQSVLRVLVE